MKTLLKVVGGIWAVIGVANIVMMPWGSHHDTVLSVGLLINFIFFLFPGLVLCGIGAVLPDKVVPPVVPPIGSPVAPPAAPTSEYVNPWQR